MRNKQTCFFVFSVKSSAVFKLFEQMGAQTLVSPKKFEIHIILKISVQLKLT